MTRLLLVGEGDFTIALSLVQNSRKGALELTATGFDSLAEVKAKYALP